MRWLLAALLTTTVALAAGPAAQNLPDGDGKQLVTTSCTSCHGLDLITAKQVAKSEWDSIVDRMKTYGVTLSAAQTTTVVDYLAKSFPPKGAAPAAAPAAAAGQNNNDAAGKALVEGMCASCHGADLITAKKSPRSEWKDIVDRMKGYGASMNEAQTNTLLDYLEKNYGTGAPPAAKPATPAAAAVDPGKTALETYCGGCHDLDLVTGKKDSQSGWQDTVDRMNARGAGLPDKDVPVLVQYLTKTYGVK